MCTGSERGRAPLPVNARQLGFTLVELIVFIVVVSAALAGVLLVLNQGVLRSADPQLRKQALLVAEALLEEIQLMPMTWCDPDDPAVDDPAVTGTAGCAVSQAAPTAGETRGGGTPFDNVIDYDGYTSAGVRDAAGNPVAGLENYTVSVAVQAQPLGNITAASGDALRISVTVSGPDGSSVTLEGWRTRHAPRAAP